MGTETVDRMIPAELDVSGDGRTIVGRCVPYGTPALVDDGAGPYLEVWRRGAFRDWKGMRDPARTTLVWNHDESSVLNRLAHGVAFTESDDGLEGTFRAYSSASGDNALESIRSGSVSGLSIRAAVIRSRQLDDGTLERQAARLVHVALVELPAFDGARVSAIRSGSPPALELVELRAVQDRLRVKYAEHV